MAAAAAAAAAAINPIHLIIASEMELIITSTLHGFARQREREPKSVSERELIESAHK